MSYTPTILALNGSLREGSVNGKILEIAVEGVTSVGANVIHFNLKDYPLPIYDQDDEEQLGLHKNAVHLKSLMKSSDALLIASPEYNSSYSAALKNMIDWASRKQSPDEPMLDSFNGKIAAIISASPGALGGLRGLANLRSLLENIRVMVLPNQVTLSNAYAAFDDEGNLKDREKYNNIREVGVELAEIARKLYG